MKKILMVILAMAVLFTSAFAIQSTGEMLVRSITTKEKVDKTLIVDGKVYKKAFINKYYNVLEIKSYSFGIDYLIIGKTKKIVYAVRVTPGKNEVRLLKEFKIVEGKYVKSMTKLGYWIDIITGEYKQDEGNSYQYEDNNE